MSTFRRAAAIAGLTFAKGFIENDSAIGKTAIILGLVSGKLTGNLTAALFLIAVGCNLIACHKFRTYKRVRSIVLAIFLVVLGMTFAALMPFTFGPISAVTTAIQLKLGAVLAGLSVAMAVTLALCSRRNS